MNAGFVDEVKALSQYESKGEVRIFLFVRCITMLSVGHYIGLNGPRIAGTIPEFRAMVPGLRGPS